MRRVSWFLPAFVCLGAGVALAACSDDTDTTAATVTSSTTASGGAGTGGMTSSTSIGGSTTVSTGGGGATSTGGASSTGGGGASTGGGPPANDTCATATKETLSDGSMLVIDGTTIGATDDYSSFCGDTTTAADAPDVAYEIDVMQGGTLTMNLNDGLATNPFNGALLFRTVQCDARPSPNDRCLDNGASGAGETLAVDVAPGTYWVLVDGSGSTSGDFALTLGLAAAACGDGVVNASAGEECEPTMANDPNCFGPNDPTPCQFKNVADPVLETCPGLAEPILSGDTVLGPFDTTVYSDNFVGSCNGNPGGGQDNVFAVTPAVSGMLTLSVGRDPNSTPADQIYCQEGTCLMDGMNCSPGCWNEAIYVRSTCGDATSEIACNLIPGDFSAPATITFPVTAATTYSVFVDGDGANTTGFEAGQFYIYASLN